MISSKMIYTYKCKRFPKLIYQDALINLLIEITKIQFEFHFASQI